MFTFISASFGFLLFLILSESSLKTKGIRFFTQVLEKVQEKVSPEDLEFKFCREATRGVVWMDLENNKPIGLTSLE